MRAVQDAGFECGIHTWDHVLWQDNVAKRDAAWTQAMMRKAAARFTSVRRGAAHPRRGRLADERRRFRRA
jgi:peptidoglycan/xylan/chitin deacetylase (PgdA/CDA1 family)